MEGERPQVFLVQQAGRVLVATLVAHVPQLLRRPQLELHRIAPLSLLFLLLVISLHLSGILVSKKKYLKSGFPHLLPHPGGRKRSCRSSMEARPPPTRGEAPHWRRHAAAKTKLATPQFGRWDRATLAFGRSWSRELKLEVGSKACWGVVDGITTYFYRTRVRSLAMLVTNSLTD